MEKSIPVAALPKETIGEITQAKIRIGLHTLFVILTFAAYRFDPGISFTAVVVTSVASFGSAFGLYHWATHLQVQNAPIEHRVIQRSASILSDNLFVTLVLAIGGQSTAGLWAIYLWTSIGYGVRYGIQYLNANVIVSASAFGLMAYLTPFWHERPPFVLGMLLGMILVPLYTGFLIKKLHSAVQERESAYKAKSEFLARMSHELRTPLHAIISSAELLKGKSKSAIQNDYVDTISLSSTTLLELINRVLDLSKFESGQVGLAKEPINIHQLLADAVNIFYQQGQSKKVGVRLYSDAAIPANLIGSPAHLREVFLNILGNALKFTDEGYVSITATVTAESQQSTQIRFEVIDTGCGIPERDLARIFEPFMQSDQSITRKHSGTGLGTSFAREIIRLMGGEISISSVVGLGTTVRFSIPFELGSEMPPSDMHSRSNIAVLGARQGFHLIREALASRVLSIREFHARADLLSSLAINDPSSRIDAVFVDGEAYGHILPTIPAAIADLNLSRIVPVIGFGDPGFSTVAVTSGYCSYVSSSSLTARLPTVITIVESFNRSRELASNETDTRRVSKSLNILVADDNATNRKIAQIALEEAGHRCTLVANGDDALFALNDVAFDAALLDMHMPGRDGIEVAKIYRFAGFDRGDPIPIILLTADCTKEARDEAESAGITKFLTKPILPSQIVRAVEEVADAYEDAAKAATADNLIVAFPTLQSPDNIRGIDGPVEHGGEEYINSAAVAELNALMSGAEQNEFFAEFCEDALAQIKALEGISSAADVGAVREAMHALAGAALVIGASRLAESARRIEKADTGAIVINSQQFHIELSETCDRTIEEINRLFMSTRGEGH